MNLRNHRVQFDCIIDEETEACRREGSIVFESLGMCETQEKNVPEANFTPICQRCCPRIRLQEALRSTSYSLRIFLGVP